MEGMQIERFDYKKKCKELYQPKLVPSVIDVPQMKFIMIDGCGNPNEENGEYQTAVYQKLAVTMKFIFPTHEKLILQR